MDKLAATPQFLTVKHTNATLWDIFHYWVWGDVASGARFHETSDDGILADATFYDKSIMCVVALLMMVIGFFRIPMEWTGEVIEFFLNLPSNNGGIFRLLLNVATGKVVIPQRGSDTFISFIGHLDGRVDLYKYKNTVGDNTSLVSWGRIARGEPGNRALMDLCIMAAALAYENAKVVQNVVNLHWKKHFVGFYDCWNEFQKDWATHVFIMCDKREDANLILISFRGTGPFDADDWSTDLDYSWHDIPEIGKVHTGFLEAMGLGDRKKPLSFTTNLQNSEEMLSCSPTNMSAYCTVKRELKSLLNQHKNAKFVVTGHSLGGALAILFPIVLEHHKQDEVMQRLLSIYTFGQPRVGHMDVQKFMEARLESPTKRYFRLVYCHDVVPRVPYDDKIFLFKHFGLCLYYDSLYNAEISDEEPDKNCYGLQYAVFAHLTAVWELVRGIAMSYIYGPEFEEGWFLILFRVFGVFLPGISSHCVTNYINSIRLGKESRR